MLIAIEGMDGVGKTTIAKYISEKYDYKFIEKPLHFFYNDGAETGYSDFMNVAVKLYDVEDSYLRLWYFSLGNLYVSRMLNKQNVVVDRHLVSNYYWNCNAESEFVFKTLLDACGVPDLTILLHASVETRMQRLKKRNINDPDLFDSDKKKYGYDKMLYVLNKYNIPYVLIDTENKTIKEVEQMIDAEMEKLKVLDTSLKKVKKLEWESSNEREN